MNLIHKSIKFQQLVSSFSQRVGLVIVVSLLYSFYPIDDPSYKEKMDQWHQTRVNALKNENGWLNLAGLFWLKEGPNSVGRGTTFDVAFPAHNSSINLGTLLLRDSLVQFTPVRESTISLNGEPVTKSIPVFAATEKPPVLAHGSLRWFIIRRGKKYGVRLRDLDSPQLKEFHGIERYPVDESWRITAQMEAPTTAKTIPIVDVLGQTSQYPLAGTIVFKRAGKTYRLDAANEGNKLFILFGDQTNTHDTYGAGRFLYADKADTNGSVVLDFNQAINPPCAFTTFATCPLPPPQNKLALAITAGEKRYGDH